MLRFKQIKMKKLFLLYLPIALLYACGEKPHKTELVLDKKDNGLQIVSARDTFNKYDAKYHIISTIKNTSKDKFDDVIVTVEYFDEVGDKVAETTAAPKGSLAAGASVQVENDYDCDSYKTLPYKMKISVKDMFK